MSCSSSCRAAAAAALARRDAPRSASREPRPTAPEPCYPASGGLRSAPSRSTIISAYPPLRNHAVVARESCVKIDPDLPLELAALFGCAVLTGVGAVINTAKVEPGQSVAVVGLGGVGLSAVLGARLGRRASDRRGRFIGRQARLRRETRRDPRGQRRRAGRGRVRYAASPAAGSTSPSTWPAPLRRWSSPMRRPRAAGRP